MDLKSSLRPEAHLLKILDMDPNQVLSGPHQHHQGPKWGRYISVIIRFIVLANRMFDQR